MKYSLATNTGGYGIIKNIVSILLTTDQSKIYFLGYFTSLATDGFIGFIQLSTVPVWTILSSSAQGCQTISFDSTQQSIYCTQTNIIKRYLLTGTTSVYPTTSPGNNLILAHPNRCSLLLHALTYRINYLL